jgi:hypothetical protein
MRNKKSSAPIQSGKYDAKKRAREKETKTLSEPRTIKKTGKKERKKRTGILILSPSYPMLSQQMLKEKGKKKRQTLGLSPPPVRCTNYIRNK